MDHSVEKRVFAFLNAKGEIPGHTETEQLAYPYLDEGLVDSMGIVEMVMTFEDAFGLRFEPKHMQALEFRTVGGLIKLIEQLMVEQNTQDRC